MSPAEKVIAAAVIATLWVMLEAIRRFVLRRSANAHVHRYYRGIPYIYVPVLIVALIAIAVV